MEKLYLQYKANRKYRLIYVVFPFSFDNTLIEFDKSNIHVFSPQFLPIYVNPRNDKLQAYYDADMETRTRQEFLNLLVQKSTSIELEQRPT